MAMNLKMPTQKREFFAVQVRRDGEWESTGEEHGLLEGAQEIAQAYIDDDGYAESDVRIVKATEA